MRGYLRILPPPSLTVAHGLAAVAAAVATVAHGEGVEMGMSSKTKLRLAALSAAPSAAASKSREECVEQRAAPGAWRRRLSVLNV